MTPRTKNIMIDLETLDTAATAAILSIGAIAFDEVDTGAVFYSRVDLQSCIDAKLTISGSTFKWWLGQNEAARFAISDAQDEPVLYAALDGLRNAFNWEDTIAWGNGADFDLSILDNAYRAFGEEPPWLYYNTGCYRSLKRDTRRRMSEAEYTAAIVKPKIAHHALEDARAQAQSLINFWNHG